MLPGAATASSLVVAIFMPVFTPAFTPVLAPTLASAFPPVSVAAAPGLPCPTADAVERAIAGLRGADPAATGPTYRLRIGPVGDSVRADLTSADGAAVWTRALPGGPAVCTSGAEAIALIVEREFRQITWTPPPAAEPLPGTSAPGPARPAASAASTDFGGPAASVASAPASTAGAAAAGSQAPAPPSSSSSSPRLAASVGPALWSRAGTAALAIEAHARVAGTVQAGLGALLPPSSSSLVLYTAADGSNAAQAKVMVLPFLMALGGERPVTRRLALGVSAEGLLTFERGESVGIASPQTAWRTVLAGGLAAGGAVALGDRLRLDVRAGAYRTLLGRSFTVDGVGGDLLEPPAWQALVRVGLGWVFVP